LVLPVHTGGAGADHGLLQLVGVERATEAGLGVRDDRGEPVLDRLVILDAGDLVSAQEGVVDAADHGRDRVGGVQRLVGVRVTREVGVAGDLPAGEVDGLEAGADLLHGLVARQRTEGVDEVLVVDLVPQDLRATTGEGVLLDDGALQLRDLLGRVVAGNALPAGVGVPVLLDLRSGTCLADVRHSDSFLLSGADPAFAQLPRPISCTRPDCHIANTASTCDLCEVGEFSQQICKVCKDSVYCHWPTGSTLTADETDVTPTPDASQGVHGWPQDTWARDCVDSARSTASPRPRSPNHSASPPATSTSSRRTPGRSPRGYWSSCPRSTAWTPRSSPRTRI